MNKEEIICPGETIKELLEIYNYTQQDLAQKLNINLKTANELLNGKAPITIETAIKLEYIFNVDASFWNNFELNYRRKLKALEEQQLIQQEYEKIESVYKEMVKRNLVEDSKEKETKLINFKKYMEIVNISQLEDDYYKIACRKAKVDYNYINLLVWIQIGLKKSRDLNVQKYDKDKIISKIPEIKELTRLENQEIARKKLTDICNSCGLIVNFEKSMPHTAIYGIAKWLTPNKPFIQISDRGKELSTFWFTFFHELGHIIDGKKKSVFLDNEKEMPIIDNNNKEDTRLIDEVEEIKADNFAINNLLDKKIYKELKNKRLSNEDIIEYANKMNISSCILAGILRHDLNEYQNRVLNSFRIKLEL